MHRKLIFPLVLIILLSLTSFASADAVIGCYATATPATVNEGGSFTVTLQCDDIETTNNVFGFQIGTTRAGDFEPGTVPTTYTAGTFSSSASNGVIEGTNALSALYAVTRKDDETVDVEDFTFGSYSLDALNNLTANGSVTITLTDADFILSDNTGTALNGFLRDEHDVTVTVTNLDLAWLNGNMAVRSDVTAITNIGTVELVLGDRTYDATDVATFTNTFNMDDTHQYAEDGSPSGDGTLNIAVTADMTGHLACTTDPVNLGDTGAAIDVATKIGTAGTITLLAGDADNDGAIDNADATAIGANFGANPGDDRDINGDDTINILDLVHVGRNFDTAAPTSCGTGDV